MDIRGRCLDFGLLRRGPKNLARAPLTIEQKENISVPAVISVTAAHDGAAPSPERLP